MPGFIPIRTGLNEHIKNGRLGPFDLGVYAFLHLHADWATGIYTGCALGIAVGFGDSGIKKHIQKSLQRLKDRGYINYRKGDGTRGAYRILINKYEPRSGELSGTRLNAWKHGELCQPEYEPCATVNGRGTVEGLWNRTVVGLSDPRVSVSAWKHDELCQPEHEARNGGETVDGTVDGTVAGPIQEYKNIRSKEVNPSPRKKRSEADSRFQPFVEAISTCWKSKNPVPFVFDSSDGNQLKLLLRASPKLTLAEFETCLRHRADSDCVHCERPRTWLGNVLKYANGPLDRYGRPAKQSASIDHPIETRRETLARLARENSRAI